MGAEDPRTPIAELPADEQSIDQALADLDAKLATWLAAMNAALGRSPDRVRDADAVAEDAEDKAVAVSPVPETPVKETAAADGDGPAPVGFVRESPAPRRAAAGRGPTCEPGDPSAAEQKKALDEDEALLAELDEQTRAAIQIKRRLFGRQKSVRELLAEMGCTGTVPKEANQESKRWWRRRT